MPEKNELKRWNTMIYLAGENNLAEECIYALKEMKRAAPESGSAGSEVGKIDELIKIVAQLDAGGLGGNELRYILERGDTDGTLNSDEITTIDTSETSYRSVLKDFISSSIIKRGLAEKYAVILSGHGDGVVSDFLSRDNDTTDNLSIPKLQWVLREVRNDLTDEFGRDVGDVFMVDLLGLDSCMMSMAEIAYELRNYVRFMVAAEGFEPNTGWPYERVSSEILSNPDIGAKELAVQIVKKYITYYSDYLPAGRSVDQAACDLSKSDALAAAMRGLSDILIEKLEDPESMRQIVLAHWEAQSYKEDQYVDLFDFCDLLERGPAESSKEPVMGSVVLKGMEVDPRIVEACQAVKKVLRGDDPMILKSCYSGPAVQYSYGLSIYFPWSQVIESYEELEFARDTHWNHFLVEYVDRTRRRRRPCLNHPENATMKGRLSFNPTISGFDFLLTNNKDVPKLNRVMSNKVGTMKNPALEYVPCKCE